MAARIDPNDAPPGGRTPDQWFNTGAVLPPALGTFGTLGNMAVTGPGVRNLDFSIFKKFQLTERFNLTYRAEFFNMFNTPHFPANNMGTTEGNSNFGRLSGTRSGTERHVQFALRLAF